MTNPTQVSEDAKRTPDPLLACPFCGAGTTHVTPRNFWTGMRNEVISVEVKHWCEQTTGLSGSSVTMRAKTEAEAVAKWNKRI